MKVALVGSPNSGKTSLFNWLTGSRFKTVNYAGSTVAIHRGKSLPVYGEPFSVVDTPGVYSLSASSLDEEVALDFLFNESDLDRVILVLDASQLRRQLLLALQLQELNIPFSIALTMSDLMKKDQSSVNTRALSEIFGGAVVPVDSRLGGGLKELVESAIRNGEPAKFILNEETRLRLQSEESVKEISEQSRILADRVTKKVKANNGLGLDRWLLNSVLSLPIFLITMSVLFTCVFFLAAPLMDLVDLFFSTLSGLIQEQIGEGLFSQFLTSGLIEGTGAVLVFVPQIFILFLGLSFLEESGYLARASALIDRPLHLVGLSGRSFVPILSGFACAVPAVMATRNLKSERERWIAVFILPFMTCSARLPVYALLLAFLFFGEAAWKPGISLAAIYFISALIGGVAALMLHKILKGKKSSYFLMELPRYRWPKLKRLFFDSYRRTKSYVVKVGPTILGFVLFLWVTTHFPYNSMWSETEQLRNSVMGHIGHILEPLFMPMGLDWRAGVALLSAFVAREVFVSAMAVIFNLSGIDEASLQGSLIEQMQQAQFPDGSLIFTTPTVVAMIVYFMIALQCVSTTGVTIKEMGSWKYGIVQLVSMNVAAYVFAVATYQVLNILF